MHGANLNVWQYLQEKYSSFFHGPNRVIECGSHDVNGTTRQFFSEQTEYIGGQARQ